MSRLKLRHDYGRHVANPFFGEDEEAVKKTKNLGKKTYRKRDQEPRNTSTSFNSSSPNPPTASPCTDDLIKSLSSEITILNYKNDPIVAQDPNLRRATIYFRSHIDKRLIGAFVTLRTFQNECVTQKQVLDRFPHLKKPFVSLFFKHCVAEGWFTQRPSDFSKKIFCYEASDMVLRSSERYYLFCVSSRNKLQFI